MNVLLTGSTGFLGSRLAAALSVNLDVSLVAAARRCIEIPAAKTVEIRRLDANTDWSNALVGQQVVIHAAARAHMIKNELADSLGKYRRINVDGTVQLARQAAKEGVNRFIFMSSIKVNGERTTRGQAFNTWDPCFPEEAYAISKWEAEQALWEIGLQTGMEVVVIRPPLVYGPGVKGNFATLIKAAKRGLPLPLGAIGNKRSLVALDNLVDLIITCIDNPAAANQTFLASDGYDLSTTELLRRLGQAINQPARLIPVPPSWLRFAAKMLRKTAEADRLLGDLQVDITHTCKTLDWTPPISVEEGLRRCFSD